jgi:hypothetical protein
MLSIRNGAISAAVAAAIALGSFTPANASSRGDRAMLGAVAGVFGAIATIAAANAARNAYYEDEPVYVAPQAYPAPVYAAPVYGPGYRGHWRHHRHWHR